MPSHLVKETDEEIYVYRYISVNDDEISAWIFDDKWNWKYPEKVVYADDLYELRVDYKINKETGEVTLLGVR